MSIVITLLGAPVTPEEAAKALNVVNGPWVVLYADHKYGDAEATVYARFRGSKGSVRPPWLSCRFTADTVAQVRECAHVVSTAADLIVLAAMLDRAATACNCVISGGDVIPPACAGPHGIPCENCGGVESCADDCGEVAR